MGSDYSVNGYSFDLDTDEFDLESILQEYQNFDPAAPAPVPRAKAEFEARPVTAELLDADDAPEEPLGPVEQALAEPFPEEPEPEAPSDPFASYAEDYPDRPEEPAPKEKPQHRTWRESLGLPPQAEEPEEDVREYRPGQFHAARRRVSERSRSRSKSPLGGLRGMVGRITGAYGSEPPEDDEFDPEEPDEPLRTELPHRLSEPDEPTVEFRAVSDRGDAAYAPRTAEEYAAEADQSEEAAPERPDFRETVLQPILTRIAAISYRIRESQARAREAADADEPLGPEPTPEDAAKYYGAQIRSLKLRGRVSLIVSVILLYISLGLPVFGLLRSSPPVLALTCLILLLTSMLAGLDVLVTGILALFRRRPGLETMVALSAIFSIADAIVCAILGEMPYGLPFCGASALALTFCLYSARFTCQSLRKTFRALQKAHDPISVFSDSNVSKEGITLMKSDLAPDGFIHRAEESSPAEAVYTVLSPYMMILGLVLSLLAVVVTGEYLAAPHVLAAIFAAFVPLMAIVSFSLPFRTAAQRLFSRGIALAGWSGASDIGRSAHMIITDDDIFPPNTVQIGAIRILEGAYPQRVISAAASVVIASGSCLAPVFAELLEKHHARLIPVSEFSCGKTGGLTAMVDGEEVMVGGADFVNLRGIRLPEKLAKKDTLFVVVSGQLVGIIQLRYTPVKSVQNALLELLRSRQDASFAVRDSNITPVMLRQKFKVSADGFHFPSYAKRYAMSAAEPSEETHVAGVMARRGLGSFVRLASVGRRLYGTVRTLVVLSLIAAGLGAAAMFLLLAMGSFDAATVTNLLLYQLLWLIPLVVLNLGLNR